MTFFCLIRSDRTAKSPSELLSIKAFPSISSRSNDFWQESKTLIDQIIDEEHQVITAYLIDGPFNTVQVASSNIGEYVHMFYVQDGVRYVAEYTKQRILGLFAYEFIYENTYEIIGEDADFDS